MFYMTLVYTTVKQLSIFFTLRVQVILDKVRNNHYINIVNELNSVNML